MGDSRSGSRVIGIVGSVSTGVGASTLAINERRYVKKDFTGGRQCRSVFAFIPCNDAEMPTPKSGRGVVARNCEMPRVQFAGRRGGPRRCTILEGSAAAGTLDCMASALACWARAVFRSLVVVKVMIG
jgi:hypothetical protein